MKKLNSRKIAKIFTLGLISVSFGFSKNEDTAPKTPASEVMYAEITNARIAYKTYGEGEPLIMCIGYASNMDLWSTKAIEILQQKFKVIVFDYRGMGYSTNTNSEISINSMAEDVNELLIALNINKAHVLGWSMGGFVAQIFALHHSEKVDKLVLYATNCGDTIAKDPSQEIIDILSNPSSTPLELIGCLFPDEWMASHPEPWKSLPNAKEPHNSSTIGLQYAAVQKWLLPGGGSAGLLNQLKMPVLLICGDKDKVAPCENSTILSNLISSATFIKVNNSGHGLMYQLPETFSNYVLTFLTE
ncbi:MAG: alpha/beta fold hydrolase [Bacteroidales bacterium]